MSQVSNCTVCQIELSEPHNYEGRSFCDAHLRSMTEDVPALWQANGIVIGAIVTTIVILVVLNQFLGGLSNSAQIAIGIVVSLAPVTVWLLTIYRTSRSTQYAISPLLPTILLLSALLAAAITRSFLFDWLGFDVWLTRANASNRFLGSILIGGITHSFFLFSIVRFTVFPTQIFDRRADGVLYSVASTLGYVTALNMLFVIDQQGLALLNGGLRLLTLTSGFLSTGIVVGYFLGRLRFADLPFYFLTSGIALSAVTNGLLLYIGTELNNIRLNLTADGFSPWPGTIVNLIALLLINVTVYGLIQRTNSLTGARLNL